MIASECGRLSWRAVYQTRQPTVSGVAITMARITNSVRPSQDRQRGVCFLVRARRGAGELSGFSGDSVTSMSIVIALPTLREMTTGTREFAGPPTCSPAVAARRLDRGPARLQPRHGHPEGRTGHVVEADLVEEVHRIGVSPVLATDAEF